MSPFRGIDWDNYASSKIYWRLNLFNQWDHRLIRFIKEELIIPPPSCSKKWLNLTDKFDPKGPWKHQGQNGEPIVVEQLYNLDSPRIVNGITIVNGIILELIFVVHM